MAIQKLERLKDLPQAWWTLVPNDRGGYQYKTVVHFMMDINKPVEAGAATSSSLIGKRSMKVLQNMKQLRQMTSKELQRTISMRQTVVLQFTEESRNKSRRRRL